MKARHYEFKGGYPTTRTVQQAYDDADLTRAIQAYKFFFPTVSIAASWDGNARAGLKPNTVAMLLRGRCPSQARCCSSPPSCWCS